uniref:SURP and G-patch domain-containing protein 2 n=1 Tax=Sphenodon punctatus TaxID=8508 RepID=A0A8D0H397_SPHPU
MATRRFTREAFKKVVQDKETRYHMDESDDIEEVLHQFKARSRPAPRSRYEGSYDDGRYSRDSSQHRSRDDWKEDPREDYPGPSYRPSSPSISKDDYYHEHYGRSDSQNRDYGRPDSLDQDYDPPDSQDWNYGRPDSRDQDYGLISPREYSRTHDVDFGSSELLGDLRSPGLLEDEYGSTATNQDYDFDYGIQSESKFRSPVQRGGVGRGRGLRGKRGMATRGMVKNKVIKGDVLAPLKKWIAKKPSLADQLGETIDRPNQRTATFQRPNQRLVVAQRPNQGQGLQLNQRPIRRPVREIDFDLVAKTDIFATFGKEIIRWAGFSKVATDAEFTESFRALFKLETETCAKTLASFKCLLKPEHRDYCFMVIKGFQHAALKTPRVDNELLNMLLDKGVMKTKNDFFEIIKPFDKCVMRLQDRLLKSATPLLMACNAYELSTKTGGFSNFTEMSAAFETTISLCCKSLALLGQTFALASAVRQEKILEAVGLWETAPAPALFPNFDDSTLFGREYMENLKAWLEKSGCPIQMKKSAPEPSPAVSETRSKLKFPQRADRKVIDTIEKLVNSIIAGTQTAKERAAQRRNPEYWFLNEEDSLEYKYYKLKLKEMQRLVSPAKEGGSTGKTPEECATESMRAMLYARKVASIKKRVFKRKRLGFLQRSVRGRKVRKSTIGTQTLLSAGTMLKRQDQHPQGLEQSENHSSSEKAGSSLDATSPEESLSLEGVPGIENLSASPGNSQFPDVDAKTMETAEKLAKFVAQVGPEIEQFSIDNSADNPDLWFLQDRNSSAFQFYRMKVYELCPSINFSAVPETTDPGGCAESEKKMDNSEEEEEEEAELEEETSQPLEDTEAEMEHSVVEEEEAPAEGGEETPVSGEAPSKTGEENAGGEVQPSTFPNLPTHTSTPAPVTPFPRKRISSKSLKVGMIPASKRVCLVEEPQVHEPVRIAYDRPRSRPNTKKKKPKDLAFVNRKLTDKNVGFQILQKMGWQEGRGLGPQGRGIKEPVKVGSTSAGEGLGVAGEENKEDTFDVFRQRMIQMYRQKRASK